MMKTVLKSMVFACSFLALICTSALAQGLDQFVNQMEFRLVVHHMEKMDFFRSKTPIVSDFYRSNILSLEELIAKIEPMGYKESNATKNVLKEALEFLNAISQAQRKSLGWGELRLIAPLELDYCIAQGLVSRDMSVLLDPESLGEGSMIILVAVRIQDIGSSNF